MKPGRVGGATGLPRLGTAIIGATLLLKGDVFAPGESPSSNKADKTGAARDHRATAEMPDPIFGQSHPDQNASMARSPAAHTTGSSDLAMLEGHNAGHKSARSGQVKDREVTQANARAALGETIPVEQALPVAQAASRTPSGLSQLPDRQVEATPPPMIAEIAPASASEMSPESDVPRAPAQAVTQAVAGLPPVTQAIPPDSDSGAAIRGVTVGQDPAPAGGQEPGLAAAGEPGLDSLSAEPASRFAEMPQPAFGAIAVEAAMPERMEAAEEGDQKPSSTALSWPALTVVETTISPAVSQPPVFTGPTEPPQSEVAVAVPPESLAAPARVVLAQPGSALPKPEFGAVDTAPHMPRRSRNIARPAVVNSPTASVPASSASFPQASAKRPETPSGLLAGPGSGELAASRFPAPAFGGTPLAPAPLREPVRLAHAETAAVSTRFGEMPSPSFGFPATVPDGATKLAASRSIAAIPLSGAPPRANMPGNSSAAPPRTSLTNTSPRMPGDPAPNFAVDDELILQLQTSRGELADTITAYGTRAAVYLPLGAIARFLDLAIPVSDDGHYASGWFLDEKQTLSINLRQGALVINGKELALLKSDAAAFEGELYLRAERFAELFPLTLTVDLRAQTVMVKTTVPFPFEERIARDEERARLAGGGGRLAKRWPREQTPYQALSFPMADVELRGVSDSTQGTRTEGDVRLAGDFAFMTARAFASATSRDGLTGARIELGRRDPDGELLGPLKATEFQLGDVITTALPLGLRGVSGRGAYVSNAPLERASVFDSIDLRGELPDGYEVELYRNNILIGSTRSPVNGQYQFLKTTVDYGLNVFRLVFFGPQGQRYEDVRQFSVGDGRLSKGEFIYSVGAAQKDVNVFNVRPPDFSPGLGYGSWRGSALLEYGVTGQLTGSLGGAWYESGSRNRWLATAGLRTGIFGTALKLDLGYQSQGGKAAQLGLGGELFGFSYTLTHGEYFGGFADEVRSLSSDPLRRATELNLNRGLQLGGRDSPLVLQLNGQFRRVQFADGHKQTDATLRGSLPISGLMLSNTLNYASTSAQGLASPAKLTGIFDLATLRGSRLQLRASVDYGVMPRLQLRGASLDADYALDERTLVRASIGHTLADSMTQLGLSAVRRFRKFELGLQGSYAVPTGVYSAALRLGVSFGRNPLNRRLFFAESGLASGGAVAARAFQDSNGNSHFDAGERVLPDVEFSVGSARGISDREGIVFLGRLGDGNRANLVADRESLPDISLAPVREGVEVVPRAGRVHVTDYALQELSDIEGTAYFSEDEGIGQAVSGLRLELIDHDGKALARARTEGDGTFFFEQVQPGAYLIQIDKNQSASLKIRLSEAISVTVGQKTNTLKQVVRVSRNME